MQQVPSPELRELVGEKRCLLDIDGLNWLHPLPHEVCEAVEHILSNILCGTTTRLCARLESGKIKGGVEGV